MFTCKECGRELHEEFWFRHCYQDIEYYCDKCAFGHMDEYGRFGLMLTTESVENRRRKENGKNV